MIHSRKALEPRRGAALTAGPAVRCRSNRNQVGTVGFRLRETATLEDVSSRLDPSPPSRGRVSMLVAALTGLIVLLAAVVRNTYLFGTGLVYDGDFAANAILIDRARHFELLVGNYSRVGFNHPGPFFMYVQAWSDMLFRDLLDFFPQPYNAYVFGIMLLNAALVGGVGFLVHQHTRSIVAAGAVAAVSVAFAGSMGATLSQPWMPYVYICPFLFFLVACASGMAGRARSLPLVVLGGGLLVHGHVSFASFVGGIATVVVVVLLLQHRSHLRSYVASIARPLWWCLALLVLFTLPIVLHTVVEWPGEIRKYVAYGRNNGSNRHGLVGALASSRAIGQGAVPLPPCSR